MAFSNLIFLIFFIQIVAGSLISTLDKYSLQDVDSSICENLKIFQLTGGILNPMNFNEVKLDFANIKVAIGVAHGFLGSCDGPASEITSKVRVSVLDIMKMYAEKVPGAMVICFDYGFYSGANRISTGNPLTGYINLLPLYSKAAEKVDAIARCFAELFILFLKNGGEIYMHGHSLGAHIVGGIGRVLYQILKPEKPDSLKITIFALDPAGPPFYSAIFERYLFFCPLNRKYVYFIIVIDTSSILGSEVTGSLNAEMGHVRFIFGVPPYLGQLFCAKKCKGYSNVNPIQDPFYQICSHLIAWIFWREANFLGPNPGANLGFVGYQVINPLVPLGLDIFGSNKLTMNYWLKKPDEKYWGFYFVCIRICPKFGTTDIMELKDSGTFSKGPCSFNALSLIQFPFF